MIAQFKQFVLGEAFHGSSLSWLSVLLKRPGKWAQGVHAIFPCESL
ncbi:conserved hypothetical protein [delta proteobacterium NaphS2]|nr:conserved hypothetical protein [delta proteobacterium NaphS2]